MSSAELTQEQEIAVAETFALMRASIDMGCELEQAVPARNVIRNARELGYPLSYAVEVFDAIASGPDAQVEGEQI